MKYCIVLLLVFSCNFENDVPKRETCLKMEISNAIPIQFWLNGEESFNQKTVGYVDDVCFNQKFKCSDEIRLQFLDNVSANYYLKGYDTNDNVLATLPFTKSQVYPGNNSNIFHDYPLSGFTNKAIGIGPTWTLGVLPSVSLGSGITGSYALIESLTFPVGTYNISYKTTNTAAAAVFNVNILRSGVIIQNIINIPIAVGTDIYSDFQVTLLQYGDAIEIVAFKSTGSATVVTLKSLTTNVLAIPATPFIYDIFFLPSSNGLCDQFVKFKILDSIDTVLAFSDSVEFVTSWIDTPSSGSIYIQYDSVQNYAGIAYPISEYYTIRLDGRFFHERRPLTTKSLALSSSSVSTSSTLKKQKLLTLDAMPDYMHTKVLEILSHSISGEVIINGLSYLLEDAYEQEELNPFNPLKSANVYLTDKNYLKRNVI